jgi:hypothetical protein
MAQRAPWRSIGVGLLVVVASSVLKMDLLLGVGLIGATLLGAVELWHRRDFLTTTRVVRQYGILGGRRQEVRLEDIERVEFSYPRFGRAFNAGDVEVTAIGGGFTFVGVGEPDVLAQRILDARQRLLAHRERARSPLQQGWAAEQGDEADER